jgi:uncharacterized damage-inducible protein DinB
MARYNAWQNINLLGAADSLEDEARLRDRGAFFGSIAATLSHLLWGDRVWMSRFAVGDLPGGGIEGSALLYRDWAVYKRERATTDAAILDWASRLEDGDLDRDLTWYSGAAGRQVSRPFALLVTHFFNHQTHHRGQVHAMLTAAGARPGETDLFLMPDAI